MSQIEVQIMGQGYLLGCPEGGRERLMQAVDRVDGAMCRIRDAGKVKARDRIAVLAALNLAFDLADRDRAGTAGASAPAALANPPAVMPEPPAARAPAPVAAAPAAASEAPSDDPAREAEHARIRQLIDRIDRALSRDGQLI